MDQFTDTDRVDVPVGKPFALVLSDNGPGGYLWRVAELPQGIALRRADDLPPGVAAPGATGSKLFELEARHPGAYTARFERTRDWEPGADRERSVLITAR